MPFIGIGLHVLFALFCAFHVVRTGKSLYWLFILFAFPLLGSIVYFFVIYLPNSRLERGALSAIAAASHAMDPGKNIREARAEYEALPTVQNQIRLASALLNAGQASEAAQLYASALNGPFASDLELQFGAAKAYVECQRYAEALTHLATIQRTNADFRSEEVSILIAKSYAGTARGDDARNEFEYAVKRFNSFESRAEYAIWALSIRDYTTSTRLESEINQIVNRWNSLSRELNEPLLRRLKAAKSLAA